MAQLAPFLKPPTPSRSTPPPPQGGDTRERDALNYPRAPLVGFWRRMGALAFDFVGIYLIFRYGLSIVLREPLLALEMWASPIATAAVMIYFVLGVGPVGKGQTFGKFLTGIRVVRLDGGVPTLGQAAARTALLYPGVLIAFYINPLWVDIGDPRQVVYGQMASYLLMVGLFMGNVIAIVFNPFKQGLHDFVAKTLVRPARAPRITFAELCEVIGGNWQRFQRQAFINGTATALLIAALLSVLTYGDMRDPNFRRVQTVVHSTLQEVYDDRAVHLTSGVLPVNHDPIARVETFDRAVVEQFRTQLDDAESTAPMQIHMILHRLGPWRLDEAERERHARQFVEAYHKRVIGSIDSTEVFRFPGTAQVRALDKRPIRYTVLYREDLFLMFNTPMNLVAVPPLVEIEMLPATGPRRRENPG